MLQPINTDNFQQMLSQFSTTELEGMIEKSPYFQQAHLLLAKKYQQENSPKFDQQLQLAALYIQDRELLYDLFKENSTENPAVIEVPIEKEAEPVSIEAQKEEPVKHSEPQTEDTVIIALDETTDAVESIVVSANEDMALALAEIKQSMEALQQITEETRAEDQVEALRILPPAVEDPEIKHVLPVEEAIVENTEIDSLQKTSEPEIDEPGVLVEETQNEEPAKELQKHEEVNVDEPAVNMVSRIEPHTFDEWLLAFNNKKVLKNAEPRIVAEEENADEELNKLLSVNVTSDYLHGIVKEETNYAKGLEKFIELQIQKHKQPEKRRKTNEDDLDSELITETMAKVYEMQKKYNKAIKAYEALALKFPEKSSLFAARINFIKNIL